MCKGWTRKSFFDISSLELFQQKWTVFIISFSLVWWGFFGERDWVQVEGEYVLIIHRILQIKTNTNSSNKELPTLQRSPTPCHPNLPTIPTFFPPLNVFMKFHLFCLKPSTHPSPWTALPSHKYHKMLNVFFSSEESFRPLLKVQPGIQVVLISLDSG